MADNPVTQWTVISLRDDTGEVMTCVQTAGDPHEAMKITSREIYARDDIFGSVQIICAVAGDCITIMPCEDASKAADILDLKGEDDDCECGRRPEDCATSQDPDADHGDI